jgi:hypothetical protein
MGGFLFGLIPIISHKIWRGTMKNTFWLFLLALALFLMPIPSQATEIVIDAPGDIVVTSGEVVVVAGEVLDAATADNVSLADDATISEDASTIVAPVIEEITNEEASSEEAISDPADPIDDPIIVDPADPIDIPIENPVNTVPLPSTLVMLGSGLLALSGLAWRRHNKR